MEAEIKKIGYNLSDGGAGVIGVKWTEERKKQMSEMLNGENNPFYGKRHSEETKLLIGQKSKDMWKNNREKFNLIYAENRLFDLEKCLEIQNNF